MNWTLAGDGLSGSFPYSLLRTSKFHGWFGLLAWGCGGPTGGFPYTRRSQRFTSPWLHQPAPRVLRIAWTLGSSKCHHPIFRGSLSRMLEARGIAYRDEKKELRTRQGCDLCHTLNILFPKTTPLTRWCHRSGLSWNEPF